jgi:cytochrome c oxidase subunit 2
VTKPGTPSALDPAGPQARHLATLSWVLFAIAAVVYVTVTALVIIAIIRRGRDSPKAENRFIVVGGIVVPALILSVAGVLTITTTNSLRAEPASALDVTVRGERWWWAIDYPSLDIASANEIHVPVGRPVRVRLQSDNVIHSFWVPQLAGKTDLIPGQTNEMHFTADRAGTYRGECAEFCGLQHARMRFVVVVQPRADFDAWVQAHRATRPRPAGAAATGAQDFQRLPCAGCHTIAGTEATGTIGPDLTDFGSRAEIGAGTVPNNEATLGAWIADAPSIKPGALMPPLDLTGDEVTDLVAYLETLR